jgi:hypothetical protein
MDVFQDGRFARQCFNLQNRSSLEFVIKLFTLGLFITTAIKLLIAAIAYIPLVCRIRGNLKEYCAHKIDKRYTSAVLFSAPEAHIELLIELERS